MKAIDFLLDKKPSAEEFLLSKEARLDASDTASLQPVYAGQALATAEGDTSPIPASSLKPEAELYWENKRVAGEYAKRGMVMPGIVPPEATPLRDKTLGEDLTSIPFPLPKATTQDIRTTLPFIPEKAANILAGGQQAIAGALEFFESPLGVATLGMGALPKAAQRAVSGYFAYTMAKEAPGLLKEGYESYRAGDLESATRAFTQGALNTGLSIAGARHALRTRPEAVDAVRRILGETPNLPGVDQAAIAALRVRNAPGQPITTAPPKPAPEIQFRDTGQAQFVQAEAITPSSAKLPEGEVLKPTAAEILLGKTPELPVEPTIEKATQVPPQTAQASGEIITTQEPWEIPFSEFQQGGVPKVRARIHREAVEQALRDGKPIPPEVLADYPELTQQAAPQKGKTIKKSQPQTERPPDILDFIEQTAGKIRGKKSSKPGSEGYYGETYNELTRRNATRRLFSNREGEAQSWDEAVDALRREGFLSKDATVDDLQELMLKATDTRKAGRAAKSQEAKQISQEVEQREDFEKQAFQGEQSKAVSVSELLEGDEFELGGTKVKVKQLIFDPETTDLQYVVIEDGRRFGVQTVSGDQIIYPDKGEVVSKNPSAIKEWDAETSKLTKPEWDKVNAELNDLKSVANPTEQQKRRISELQKALGQEEFGFTVEEKPLSEIEKQKQADKIKELQNKRLVGGNIEAQDVLFGESESPLFTQKKPSEQSIPAAETKPKSATEKIADTLKAQEEAARARIKSRKGRSLASPTIIPPDDLLDYSIIGAAKLSRLALKGAVKFAEWSGEMLKEAGQAIKPYLWRIWIESNRIMREQRKEAAETPIQRIIAETTGIRTETTEDIRAQKLFYQAQEAAAEAGKKAGLREGRKAGKAALAPKLEALTEKLSESLRATAELKRFFRAQQQTDAKTMRAWASEADSWLEADANQIRESLIQLAKDELPLNERGRFLNAIANATKRPPILKGDPSAMYERAATIAARIQERAQEVRKAETVKEIKELVSKAIESPSVDIGYKQKISSLVRRLGFTKPSADTLSALKATQDYIAKAAAGGKEVDMPQAVLDGLEVLVKTPAKELPMDVLEAIRDKVKLYEQLGKLKVKSRASVWEIEKNAKIRALVKEATNPLEERPEFNPQPSIDPNIKTSEPISLRIRNWITRKINAASKVDKALLPIDALFDLLGDAKGTYRGWLFKNVRNPLDLGFNSAQVVRDSLTEPLERIIREGKLTEANAERIGVYAANLQEGGRARLIEMGVSPERIDRISASLTPAEMRAYKAMRQAMDATLPEVQRIMHELYNIEVRPVQNYFPMPRDWKRYEPEIEVSRPSKSGSKVDFDDLAGWKEMEGDYITPRTTATEKGFTLERLPNAKTAIRIHAFDIFYQHINDVTYLLKTQRDLKMIGEMVRGDLFQAKYGRVGQTLVLDWLDTFARQGQIGGFRRWPLLDALRKRTSAGVIGFRLASQFVHLSNVPLSVQRVGLGWYSTGLSEAITPGGQEFLKQHFAETFARGGGEPALVEAAESNLSVFGKTVVPKAVTKAGFIVARLIDRYNSQATVLAHYMRALAAKGMDPRQYQTLPIDAEAQAQALVLSRRSVASPIPKDVPQALSRGAVTGGNVSLGRTLFQFQNIFLDQWSNIRHDFARAGIMEKNPRLAFEMFLALSAMLIAETGIRHTSKEAIAFLTGYEPKHESSFTDHAIVEGVRRFPFMGQLTSQAMFGQSGVPTIDSVVDVSQSVGKAYNAKTEEAFDKEAVRTIGGILQLLGLPGASQGTEIITKLMQEE